MPVYDESEYHPNARAIAAVAIVVLVLMAMAGGWVLLTDRVHLGGGDIRTEAPGRR